MPKISRCFIVLVLIVLANCAHTSELIQITDYSKTPEKNLLSSVVQACPRLTNVDGGRGSGVLISADGIIMSDIHVVKTGERIVIDFFKLSSTNNGFLEKTFTTTGHVIFFSASKFDWALIKADVLPPNVTPLSLAPFDALNYDQSVWLFGYNKNYHWSYGYFIVNNSKSDIEYPGKKMIIAGGPGSSGGPFVNAQGQVLGIMQRGRASANTYITVNNKRFSIYHPSVAYFLPIETIHELIIQAIREKSLKIEGF